MYLARFCYDVLPINRQRAIDFIRREVDAARKNGLDARLLVPLTRGHGQRCGAAIRGRIEGARSARQFRNRGVGSTEETGNWMHAFSEVLTQPPCVEILALRALTRRLPQICSTAAGAPHWCKARRRRKPKLCRLARESRCGGLKGGPLWTSCLPARCRPPRRCAPRSATMPGATRPRRSRASSPPPKSRPTRATGSPQRARRLVAAVRRERLGKGGIDAFLHEYALSSQEGVALMCLAEALLRIPDADTVDRLIRDKLARGRLGAPSRPFGLALRQRLDLGADADRAAPAQPSRDGARSGARRCAASSRARASRWCARR